MDHSVDRLSTDRVYQPRRPARDGRRERDGKERAPFHLDEDDRGSATPDDEEPSAASSAEHGRVSGPETNEVGRRLDLTA